MLKLWATSFSPPEKEAHQELLPMKHWGRHMVASRRRINTPGVLVAEEEPLSKSLPTGTMEFPSPGGTSLASEVCSKCRRLELTV